MKILTNNKTNKIILKELKDIIYNLMILQIK